MASLYVIRGKDQGRHFVLRQSPSTLGRDPNNPIQLQDTEVSRRHAEVQKVNENEYQIIDLGSSNGTFVNGRRITEEMIRSGDRIQIGKSLMIFTGGAEPVPSSSDYGVEIVRQVKAAELSSIRRSFTFPATSTDPRVVSSQKDTPPTAATSSNQWQIIYETSQAIRRTLDIDQLLNQILELIFGSVQCDRGCIMLLDEESNQLQPAARKNRRPVRVDDRIEISKTILDYVIEHREGVLTSNALEDQRWDATASIVQAGIREALCVPMQGRYGLVGAIYVDTTRSAGEFVEAGSGHCLNEDHLQMMVIIAQQAALAIEDTSYYRAVLQSERLATMGHTIATLSHHIKNILQGIRGGSYLVDEGIKSQSIDVIRRGWRIVERNQDRISALVMDMLSFSKERQPNLESCDIRETISDVCELMQTRAAESGVELIWNKPEMFPLVSCDPEGMHRAILNIVGNAIDATEGRENAQVRIELSCPAGDQVAIRITDNGSGIAPEDLGKIFSVFESRKGNRGTGLGLPVSQKILREHQGSIDVESTVGEGTSFTLHWPIRTYPEAQDLGHPTLM
jgi:two-component system NtrC family sensor kinase